MNTHVFLVVESLPGRVHGENLDIRELTPEQKTSAKFAVSIHDVVVFGLLDYHIHVWRKNNNMGVL
jgi:sensor domain CHASE-containing protein